MKYEMTENTKKVYGHKFTQIRYEDGSLGGWIKNTSVLPQDSKARLHPNALVFGGEIRDGEIRDGEIRGGVIRGGLICGGVIYGGLIFGGVIYGGLIRGGVIYGGLILGGEIRGGVIRGGKIHKGMIVTKDPIYMILPKHTITISDNMVAVGCQVHPFDFWLDKKKVQKLGEDHNYPQAEIDLYFTTIRLWIAYRQGSLE